MAQGSIGGRSPSYRRDPAKDAEGNGEDGGIAQKGDEDLENQHGLNPRAILRSIENTCNGDQVT